MIEIPEYFDKTTELFSTWFSKIIHDFFLISKKPSYQHEFEIIQYRFGLNERTLLTLEEAGIIFEVSRERIRQIEGGALENLSELINTGKNKERNIIINDGLFELINRFKFEIVQMDQILLEETIQNKASTIFSEVNIDIRYLRLLLTLLGFQAINLESTDTTNCIAWAIQGYDSKRLNLAIKSIFTYLRKEAIAKSYDEIKIGINKNKKNEHRFTDQEINKAIELSNDLENIPDNTVQVQYEKLKSIADKIYRILHDSGEPIHARKLALILNKKAFEHGEKSRINSHHVGSRLSSDSRFLPIGRSGEWILAEWENYATDYILELMEDALHTAGEPLSSQLIYKYVSTKRPVERNAIDSYLGQDSRFRRVGSNLFALSDWGMASVSTSRQRPIKRIFSKAKLCEYIELVFNDKEVLELFVADLAQEIAIIEPKAKPESIYNQILKSPSVSITERFIKNQKRKIAIFKTNYRSKLSKLDILSKNLPVGELIQKTVRDKIKNEPKREIELVILRDTIAQTLDCPPASVYSAIAKMSDIEKIKNNSNRVICKFKKSSLDYSTHLGKIKDENLVNEIKRALSLLHIDTVDLALFQLGKIFENSLKQYMLKVQEEGLTPVSQEDLKRLFNMVRWAGKTGLISDETALHYLRLERNDRGHGVPPEIDEREALLNNAPTLVRFYLDYIVLLEQRKDKIL
jgi:hypothetical protein